LSGNLAFISYTQADIKDARRIQKWLETYKLPKDVSRDIAANRKLGRIFRDETDLSGAPDLDSELKRQIEQSDCLIVLCSPNAANAQWVDREIRHFRETGRADRIFAVILSGTPNSVDESTECFPQSFRKTTDDHLTPIEPLAVNVETDGLDRALMRLVSGMLSVRFDALWQRERRRQAARVAMATVLMTLGLTLSVVAGTASWLALSGTAKLAEQSSGVLANEARAIFDEEQGDHLTSLRMALQADPLANRSPVRKFFDGEEGYAAAQRQIALSLSSNRLVNIVDLKPFFESENITSRNYTAVTVMPVSGLAYFGTSDGALHVWNFVTGEQLRAIDGDGAPIIQIMVSDSTNRAVTITEDLSLTAWDMNSGQKLTTMRDYELEPIVFRISPDDRYLAIGSGDHKSLIWEFAINDTFLLQVPEADKGSGIPHVINFGSNSSASSAEAFENVESIGYGIGPDTEKATYSDDYSDIYDPYADVVWAEDSFLSDSEEGLPNLRPYSTGAIDAIAFSLDGKQVAVGGEDGIIWIFDLAQRAYVRKFEGHTGRISSLAFGEPGSDVLFSASWDGTFRAWNVRYPEEKEILGRFENLSEIKHHPRLPRVAVHDINGTIHIFDAYTRQILGSLKADAQSISANDAMEFTFNEFFLTNSSADGRLRTWDIRFREQVFMFSNGIRSLSRASLSADSTRIYTSGVDGNLFSVWDAETLEVIRSSTAQDEFSVSPMSFSVDGSKYLTSDIDGSFQVYDSQTEELLLEYSSLDGQQNTVFRPQKAELADKMLWSRIDGSIRVFDPFNNITFFEIPPEDENAYYVVSHAAWTRDGLIMATAQWSDSLMVRHSETGEVIAEIETGFSRVSALALSENAQQLAAVIEPGILVIWDVETGREIIRRTLDFGNAPLIQFSPDGQLIATSHENGKVALWLAETGQLVTSSKIGDDAADRMVFFEDGRRILWSNISGSQIWFPNSVIFADPETQVQMACTVLKLANVPDHFTEADLASYPVLAGEPFNADTGEFEGFCKGVPELDFTSNQPLEDRP